MWGVVGRGQVEKELVRKHLLLEEGRYYLRKDDGAETCLLGEGSPRETNVKSEQAGPPILWKAEETHVAV